MSRGASGNHGKGAGRVNVAQLRHAASILPLLPEDARARKCGAQAWVARCSFHDDTRPSMTVRHTDTGWRFHCFACGEKGDVIDYVMRTQSCSFREACERLGGRAEHDPAAAMVPPPARRAWVIACDVPGCKASTESDSPAMVSQLWGRVLPGGGALCLECEMRGSRLAVERVLRKFAGDGQAPQKGSTLVRPRGSSPRPGTERAA